MSKIDDALIAASSPKNAMFGGVAYNIIRSEEKYALREAIASVHGKRIARLAVTMFEDGIGTIDETIAGAAGILSDTAE